MTTENTQAIVSSPAHLVELILGTITGLAHVTYGHVTVEPGSLTPEGFDIRLNGQLIEIRVKPSEIPVKKYATIGDELNATCSRCGRFGMKRLPAGIQLSAIPFSAKYGYYVTIDGQPVCGWCLTSRNNPPLTEPMVLPRPSDNYDGDDITS
jgi:hypothetical protein